MKRDAELPPKDAPFWELFDYFWARGIGNFVLEDGTAAPWTASLLEQALGGTPDRRSIENWQSRTNIPSPENIRRLSWVISGGDNELRKAWYNALITARLAERRQRKPRAKKNVTDDAGEVESHPGGDAAGPKPGFNRKSALVAGVAAICAAVGGWYFLSQEDAPYVDNIRICSAHYFDENAKKCTQHVSVFVFGIDEVFLSFDFNNVPHGAPFERWWIRNGERVAGRTSFNDDAWPGWTFWRPGEPLHVGQYVVRVVVEGAVETQTFFVQEDNYFGSDR